MVAGGVAVVLAGAIAVAGVVAFTSHSGATIASRSGATGEVSGTYKASEATPPTGAPKPAQNCGDKSVIWNPGKKPPAGAIIVPTGDNENFDFDRQATYWFAAGTHTLGTGQYNQIEPVSGSTFIGGPGAVLDGRWQNRYAFGGNSTHITIEYLTIEHFGYGGLGDNQQEGVVNQDSASYWTVSHSTINDNAGAGTMLGSYNTLSYDCLENNGQYGFNAYAGEPGPTDILITHTEISHNDTYNWEAKEDGCGCTGGGKFWYTKGATVTDNYIVNNLSVGIWADTNNAGFEFEGNYFAGNYSVGLQYEISYNALIERNTFIGNGLAGGPYNSGFPTSAIYISESGSDTRVHTAYDTRLLIADNDFINNWGGVILWENSNRFCGSPDNSSSGVCTEVDPTVANLAKCAEARLIAVQPYFGDCRWKTQNVIVEHNTFTFSPKAVGKACAESMNPNGVDTCGFNGVFSEYGSDPSWSPYLADVVPTSISLDQDNHFEANVYTGPWQFMGWQLGSVMTWDGWRDCAAWQQLASAGRGDCGQDQGSTQAG
ncbi:MAG TPA: right-handed parallel beta-helix repeat-containing protein [Trebonia sp.]|nr:right-handed parallel beta-helix repeat-containing protein [Trebonia sp.]